MKLILIFTTLLYLSTEALPVNEQPGEFTGKIWVVLCAGGKGFINYSIGANVYHSYQLFRANGIPDENIIIMHYDDIAYNKANPNQGIVINEVNGTDVYHDVPKHYTGDEVNPSNFLGVLKGDKTLAKNGKKVVNSGPNDHIFVYFIDHGAPDLIVFPNEYLYGEELNTAIKDMHQNKRFAKLVFYLETCESGSMFYKLLPKDINVYAITSSAPTQDSWQAFCYTKIQACLGGLFSYYWFKDSEHKDLQHETLQEQFDYIFESANKTNKQVIDGTQQVQQYGDLSIGELPVSQFQGFRKLSNSIDQDIDYSLPMDELEVVDARDIPIHMAKKGIELADNVDDEQRYVKELDRLLNGRQYVDKHIEDYVKSISDLIADETNAILNTKQELNNNQCYRQFVDTFHQNCFNLNQNSYVLGKLQTFVNICEELHESSDVDIAVHRLRQYCRQNIDTNTAINIQ